MTTISLKLPEALLREIEQEAAARGVPKSAVIRDSLERTLRKGRKPKKRVSCLDLVRDLVGHFEGPPDLSTNKKYLKEAIMADYERRQRKNRR
jgi:Arc/MetJ-type ribon-helix-helix transcriptional regulator